MTGRSSSDEPDRGMRWKITLPETAARLPKFPASGGRTTARSSKPSISSSSLRGARGEGTSARSEVAMMTVALG